MGDGLPARGRTVGTLRARSPGQWQNQDSIQQGGRAMNRFQPRVPSSLLVSLFAIMIAAPSPEAIAKSHTWRFTEAFSNADGTVQFIELRESLGLNDETLVPGHVLSSTATGKTFTFPPPNLPATTAFKRLLIGTPAFAALFATLPGAPAPDYIVPAGSVPFFATASDTLTCSGWPNFPFNAAQLPTDGVHSLVCNLASCTAARLVVAVNSPTNYLGQGSAIDASTPPPAVPDGKAGSTPMLVSKLDAAGVSLSISFDTTSCSGTTDRQIIYGDGSQLPTAPGGAFGLTGSACSVGASPFVWNPSPNATGLVWWLMTAKDASNREGSWGKNGAGVERVGPAVDGSSAQCGVTTRNISNACGH